MGEETGSAPVVCRRPARAWWALSDAAIHFRATVYPRFMAVYAGLFYTKYLISLKLGQFRQFFSSKWAAAAQDSRLPAVADGRCRQGSGRSGNHKIDAVYNDRKLCLNIVGLVNPIAVQERRVRRR